MKTLSKIMVGIGIALILFIIVINIPFTEKINNNFEKREILVVFSKGLGIGGLISGRIYENGTIDYFSEKIETKRLFDEELNKIKDAIDNNQFTISKTTLYNKWRSKYPDCADCYTGIIIWINKNGESIKIEPNGVIWDIISNKKLF